MIVKRLISFLVAGFLSFLATPVFCTLEYSTFIGGTGNDWATDVTIDTTGNIIVTGFTSGPDFPTTAGAYDQTHNGADDVFVVKFTPDLSTLLASTLVGGDEDEFPNVVCLDHSGNIAIVGHTDSSDFPTTAGAFDPTYNGTWQRDTFVFKLSPMMNTLLSSTYVGGSDHEMGIGAIVDTMNNIVVTGHTYSDDFPITPGAFDSSYGPGSIFIYKLTADLSTLLASTFVGGDHMSSNGLDIKEDLYGNYYIAGYSYTDDFPTTPDAYDRTLNGEVNVVVFSISSDLSTLLHSTYIGGSDDDQAQGLALDTNGNVVVCGISSSPDFPTTPDAFDSTNYSRPNSSIIVFKMTPDLSTLLASTFVGSTYGSDSALGCALDPSGDIIVVGDSSGEDFPITAGAYDSYAWFDAVLLVMPPDLSALYYSTFLGGNGIEWAYDLIINGPGSVVVTGKAQSGFPVTEGAYDTDGYLDEGFVLTFKFYDQGRPGIVTGPGPGSDNPPLVCLDDSRWNAYGGSGYGVNVACGDLDGDGYDEIVTGPGPGPEYGPHVRGWSNDGSALPNVSFLAYGTNKFGVNVACGDIDQDGYDEIVTGAGPGAVFGPHVRGWNVDSGAATPMPGISYFAYGTAKWGVNVACGDLDGDGFDEIITGPGPGAVFGPHVRGWNYDGQGPLTAIQAVSYFAYGTPKWGVNVACGDLDGDGFDEIVTGAGPGAVFGPHVRGWNYDGTTVVPMAGVSYFAYPEGAFGVVVAAADIDEDGIDEILTMPGPDPDQPAHARAWNVDGGMVTAIDAFDFTPFYTGMTRGGTIAGGRFE